MRKLRFAVDLAYTIATNRNARADAISLAMWRVPRLGARPVVRPTLAALHEQVARPGGGSLMFRTPVPAARFHLPEAPPAAVQPDWMRAAGVVLREPVTPPPVPDGWHGETYTPPRFFAWFRELPGLLRFVLFATAPAWIWLAICLITLGWPFGAGYLIVLAVMRPRRRGQPARNLLRRNRVPYSKITRPTKPLFKPIDY